jgi:hypothetical protein
MDSLAIHLALHGALVLTVALVAGLLLYRSILRNGNVAGWHLLHSGGSGRGVLLIALAGMFQLIALPPSLLSALAWLMVFFVWTSVLAMSIVAVSGEHGFDWSGPASNKIAYGLYAVGVAAVFPAVLLLITGLLNALRR